MVRQQQQWQNFQLVLEKAQENVPVKEWGKNSSSRNEGNGQEADWTSEEPPLDKSSTINTDMCLLVWLILLNIMISSSIYFPANVMISFFTNNEILWYVNESRRGC